MTTINQVLAVAWLTLKENLRSKVFFTLLLTGIAVTCISILFPVVGGIEEKVKLVESLCLKSITFFGMLIAAILSAISIPKDAEDKSIYSIITKPINRSNLVLGKILGFVYVIGITIALLGCFSIILIRSSIHTDKDLPSTNNKADIENNDRSKNKNVSYTYKVTHDSILKSRKQHTSLIGLSIDGEHQETPGGTKWVEGKKGTAVWTISGLEKRDMGKHLEIEVDLKIEGDDSFIPLNISVSNPFTDEKDTIFVDAHVEKKLVLLVSKQIVQGGDQLVLEITPENKGHFFGANTNKIKIFYNYSLFEYNFAKAVIIIFFQIVLIIFIGVTGSTFLKTPAVSIFFILFVFLCGFLVEYLKDFETVINIGDFNSHGHELHDHESHEEEKEHTIFFTFLNNVLKNVFRILTYLIPNFSKFNMEQFILNRIDIPLGNFFSLFGYASIYFAACACLSAIIVKRRDI